MSPLIAPVSVLLAASMLAGCGGGGSVGSSTGPGAESSSRTVATRGVAMPDSAVDTVSSAPHGAEIDSGAVFTVTDGNVHMAYPAGATMTRTADGVLVINRGHARKFSASAVITQSGSYHTYSPVNPH